MSRVIPDKEYAVTAERSIVVTSQVRHTTLCGMVRKSECVVASNI
jgi:hypothetical protein